MSPGAPTHCGNGDAALARLDRKPYCLGHRATIHCVYTGRRWLATENHSDKLVSHRKRAQPGSTFSSQDLFPTPCAAQAADP